MDTFILFIFLLALTPSILKNANNFVGADEHLIRLLCKNAEVPATCLQCVKSDPHAIDANQVGIASIIVGCLTNNIVIVKANMSTLASSTSDKNLKKSYQYCNDHWLASSKKELVAANLRLQKGEYDDATLSLTIALVNQTSCHKEVLGKIGVPLDVLSKMEIFYELSKAAMRIIEHFY